jgi:hypothetical protein
LLRFETGEDRTAEEDRIRSGRKTGLRCRPDDGSGGLSVAEGEAELAQLLIHGQQQTANTRRAGMIVKHREPSLQLFVGVKASHDSPSTEHGARGQRRRARGSGYTSSTCTPSRVRSPSRPSKGGRDTARKRPLKLRPGADNCMTEQTIARRFVSLLRSCFVGARRGDAAKHASGLPQTSASSFGAGLLTPPGGPIIIHHPFWVFLSSCITHFPSAERSSKQPLRSCRCGARRMPRRAERPLPAGHSRFGRRSAF